MTYINDKPTGALMGQVSFGGGRASGTNDKTGSRLSFSAGSRSLHQGSAHPRYRLDLPVSGPAMTTATAAPIRLRLIQE